MPLFQKTFFAVFLVLSGLPEAWAGVFNPTTFTLKNGMQVVIVENHRVPVVAHMVWYLSLIHI